MKLLSRLALIITLTTTSVFAQTKVTPPKNKYTPQQDVEIGREAAAEVRKQYPIITDSQIRAYVERLGDRLVEAAPRELNNPVFEYSFTPVNLKDINAFALPGGPMFVNRGMIEAAATEGEVAGVMAHELAHVLLRHGTANATKAQGFQIGALAGAIAGAVIGGGWVK
jgi:predicted Zn-dependent protease